jgi:uncharacterized damage-inducible protein DinB
MNRRTFRTLFRYKAWANDEIVASLGHLDGQRHPAELRDALFILNHTYLVDRIFAARLVGSTSTAASTTAAENPPLEELSVAMHASDAWFVDYVERVLPAELAEDIDFAFVDGDLGRMSRAEMLLHLVLHGCYHRGAIGRILSQQSLAPPRDVLTGYLHKSEPAARRRPA